MAAQQEGVAQFRGQMPIAQRPTSNAEFTTAVAFFSALDVACRTLEVFFRLKDPRRALVQFVRSEIETHGPVSFAWFMEQALYHPEHGFYSSGRATLGRGGDYFTNVSVGPLFGRLLAFQFAEAWERLGRIDSFSIVEQGAHEGELARDVLDALQSQSPEFFSQVRYRIVEPFAVLRERQARNLRIFGDKVDWCDSLDALDPFTGIHFSNELLDAMPVHLVCSSEREPNPNAPAETDWREKYVALMDGILIFVSQPITNPVLRDRLKKLPALPPNYETEMNLAALDWLDSVAAKLKRGFVLAVDYGFVRDEFFADHRRTGTLQCRKEHRLLASPLEQVGDADITAHVEWTSIARHAETLGLAIAGFTDQHHFLTGLITQEPALIQHGDSKSRRALQTLLHPEMFGRSFQVLALSKEVEPNIILSGFKYARDSRRALGLDSGGDAIPFSSSQSKQD
ncbi:MAG: hypothetical protein QOG67_3280 [Verrucomicrobiota bacterium]|jgi:SAM-dependent MidA family methyltransferase